jgi:hypothetical protein
MHQSGINERMKEAYKVMGMASKYMAQVQPIYEKMASTRIVDDRLYKFIMEAIKPQQEEVTDKEVAKELSSRTINTAEAIMHFARTHETQMTDATKGTVFGAYNAISGYMGWCKKYDSAEQRMKDITFGNGSRIIQRAFDNALQLV